MNTTLKALAFAAFAGFASLAAPVAAQAQNVFYDDGPLVDGPSLLPVGGFYDDGYHHPRPRHHRHHGFSLGFQFGHPQVIYGPRHPRVFYHPRPRPIIQITRAHVQWCYSRYRTYNHHNNTFVIRHGQRAYCVSPYSH